MDFSYHYTEEQEQFRQDVNAWLDANLTQDIIAPDAFEESRADAWEQAGAFRRKRGELGWLAPTEASEWGGAGLTSDHAVVLFEELDKRGILWIVDEASAPLRRALREWGTEEQKRQFLPAIVKGQAVIWRSFVEPGAELYPNDIGIQASQDGDGFILNGEAVFVGQGHVPSYLWVLALSDPDADVGQATSTFLVPASLDGIQIRTPRTLTQGDAHRVAFDQVWVPRHCLIGDEGQGWPLMDAAILAEPGVDIPPPALSPEVADLLQYAKETTHEGTALSKEPIRRQLLVEAYINSRMMRLLHMRDAWMRSTGQTITYQAAQTASMEKRADMRLSKIVQDVVGIYALLDKDDSKAPTQGRFESHQRQSLAQQNPNGTVETYAEVIIKRLGLGQGRENTKTNHNPDATTGV